MNLAHYITQQWLHTPNRPHTHTNQFNSLLFEIAHKVSPRLSMCSPHTASAVYFPPLYPLTTAMTKPAGMSTLYT